MTDRRSGDDLNWHTEHLPGWTACDRPGWTWCDEQHSEAVHDGSGCTVGAFSDNPNPVDLAVDWWWEVGYMDSGTRLDPPDWRTVHEGQAHSFDEACAAVEWIVAVEDAYERQAEEQLDEALRAQDAAEQQG